MMFHAYGWNEVAVPKLAELVSQFALVSSSQPTPRSEGRRAHRERNAKRARSQRGKASIPMTDEERVHRDFAVAPSFSMCLESRWIYVLVYTVDCQEDLWSIGGGVRIYEQLDRPSLLDYQIEDWFNPGRTFWCWVRDWPRCCIFSQEWVWPSHWKFRWRVVD